MIQAIKVPEIGENVESGIVVAVHIKVGDMLAVDDTVIDIQYDQDDGNLYKPEGAGANWTAFDEVGFNKKTNENAFNMITHDAIFTNVGRTADNEPWWEDKKSGEPRTDWQGRD